ncbi:MAG: DsbA family protein [Mesorhizobium sp.]|nr:DsbA family protein [Mesorhizobium sp.]
MWDKFYAAYFGEVRSIFDVELLVAIAGEVGLDVDAAREALISRRYRDAVLADGAEAQQLGSTGVPFIVLDRRFAVSGAQPVDALLNTLEQAWGDRSSLIELASSSFSFRMIGANALTLAMPLGAMMPSSPI